MADVFPTQWAVICDHCGYESEHGIEERAEEAATEHENECKEGRDR